MSTSQPGSIGPGWRLFQVVALISAVSWLFSYLLGDPLSRLEPAWGSIVWVLSPIISIFIIGIAVAPEKLSFMKEGSAAGLVARGLLLIVAGLWMVNVFVGTPMVDKLFTEPLAASRMIPAFAGVFLHVVFQHWFQSLAAVALALVPEQFSTITDSPTPAGVQCAVVECE